MFSVGCLWGFSTNCLLESVPAVNTDFKQSHSPVTLCIEVIGLNGILGNYSQNVGQD